MRMKDNTSLLLNTKRLIKVFSAPILVSAKLLTPTIAVESTAQYEDRSFIKLLSTVQSLRKPSINNCPLFTAVVRSQ